MAWFILLTVAWGALAFGAIYEWARWPLLVACAAAGALGFAREVPRERRGVNGPILLGLMLVAVAVGVQLVPLESRTIRRLSPATHEFLKQYDLRYALPTIGDASPEGPASILYGGTRSPQSPHPQKPKPHTQRYTPHKKPNNRRR